MPRLELHHWKHILPGATCCGNSSRSGPCTTGISVIQPQGSRTLVRSTRCTLGTDSTSGRSGAWNTPALSASNAAILPRKVPGECPREESQKSSSEEGRMIRFLWQRPPASGHMRGNTGVDIPATPTAVQLLHCGSLYIPLRISLVSFQRHSVPSRLAGF